MNYNNLTNPGGQMSMSQMINYLMQTNPLLLAQIMNSGMCDELLQAAFQGTPLPTGTGTPTPTPTWTPTPTLPPTITPPVGSIALDIFRNLPAPSPVFGGRPPATIGNRGMFTPAHEGLDIAPGFACPADVNEYAGTEVKAVYTGTTYWEGGNIMALVPDAEPRIQIIYSHVCPYKVGSVNAGDLIAVLASVSGTKSCSESGLEISHLHFEVKTRSTPVEYLPPAPHLTGLTFITRCT